VKVAADWLQKNFMPCLLLVVSRLQRSKGKKNNYVGFSNGGITDKLDSKPGGVQD